jgi:aspartate/methionine/tyrosine aminotransferase
MNDRLADLRRQIQRQTEPKEKAVLNGTRWLLLNNPKNPTMQRTRKRILIVCTLRIPSPT